MSMVHGFAIGSTVYYKAGRGFATGIVEGFNGDKIVVQNVKSGKTQNKSPETLSEHHPAPNAAKPEKTQSRKKSTVKKGKVWGSKYKVGDVFLMAFKPKVKIEAFSKYHGVFIVSVGKKRVVMTEIQLDKLIGE